MGLFGELFGGKKEESVSNNQNLRLEYNIMKNITLENCLKYENTDDYKQVEDGLYEDLKDNNDSRYRMTISYELISDTSNNQYPLEDVLDQYYLHVSDFLESENNKEPNMFKLQLGGELKDVLKTKEIIGKKIYNQDYLDDNGYVTVKLIIV